VVKVEVEPLRELGTKVLLTDADSADTARLAGSLKFGKRESVDAFAFDDLCAKTISTRSEKKREKDEPCRPP
jgi:hypothetical protein